MSRVIEYDAKENIAYGKSDLNVARGYHSAVKLKDKIFVFGGSNSDSFSALPIKEIEEYDLAKEEWKIVGELKIARSCHGTAEHKGKIYITAGWGNM